MKKTVLFIATFLLQVLIVLGALYILLPTITIQNVKTIAACSPYLAAWSWLFTTTISNKKFPFDSPRPIPIKNHEEAQSD